MDAMIIFNLIFLERQLEIYHLHKYIHMIYFYYNFYFINFYFFNFQKNYEEITKKFRGNYEEISRKLRRNYEEITSNSYYVGSLRCRSELLYSSVLHK